jgi:hypothetical protein
MLNAHQEITKAIIKSQHCQRNWDLSREIPEEDFRNFCEEVEQRRQNSLSRRFEI